MSQHYHYPEKLEPTKEILDHQTDEQLANNYAQTVWNVYKLTGEQARELFRNAMGERVDSQGEWVPPKAVFINGEAVLRIKFSGEHTYTVLPYTA